MAARKFEDTFDNLQNLTETIERVDLNRPNENVITQETSTYQLLQLQAETQAKALTEAIDFMQQMLPLQATTDNAGIIAERGENVDVNEQKQYLKQIAERNNLITKMVQSRQQEKFSKQSYFDDSRTPICTIPQQIGDGDQTNVQDSALKLINTFSGDKEKEAENLKTFLRAIFDVALTNKLTTECTTAIIKRKLTGTARKLIDAYEDELGNKPNRPNLKEVVLKLEARYMADLTPEIANARLAMMKKRSDQTYQALEGEISELATLAARGEKGDKVNWTKQKKIEIFKQAIEEEDRQLIARENQSRTLNGLTELDLSQAVDFLIKTYSEKNAFLQANQLKNNKTINDYESINKIKEKEEKENKNLENENKEKNEMNEETIKEELYRLFQTTRGKSFQNNRGRSRNTFRGNRRGGRFNNQRGYYKQNYNETRNANSNWNNSNQNWNNRGNGGQRRNQGWQGRNRRGNRGNWNNRGRNNWNNSNSNNSWSNNESNNEGYNSNNRNNNWSNKGGTKKFITPQQAGVGENNCLKCDSPTHRFQERDKCIYGQSNLMSQPCSNCKRGAHHSSMCIKGTKSTIGAPPPKMPMDQEFSRWPENSKTAQENKEQFYTLFPKNEYIPSLFPE